MLFSHVNARELIATNLLPGSFGHNAVVTFFVLSGYVIAFIADTRARTPEAYWLSRVARIYSVALPALLLGSITEHKRDRLKVWLTRGAAFLKDLDLGRLRHR